MRAYPVSFSNRHLRLHKQRRFTRIDTGVPLISGRSTGLVLSWKRLEETNISSPQSTMRLPRHMRRPIQNVQVAQRLIWFDISSTSVENLHRSSRTMVKSFVEANL